jgi:hypothetical protein
MTIWSLIMVPHILKEATVPFWSALGETDDKDPLSGPQIVNNGCNNVSATHYMGSDCPRLAGPALSVLMPHAMQSASSKISEGRIVLVLIFIRCLLSVLNAVSNCTSLGIRDVFAKECKR